MTTDELSSLLISLREGTVSAADVRDALAAASEQWPFFGVLTLEELGACGSDSTERKKLQERLALTVSSPRTLAYAGLGDAWSSFYPPVTPGAPQRTDDVIDVFLRTYGSCTPEEERMLERMIFNPTPDYAEMLAREEQENLPPETEENEPDSQDARINAFIRSQHPASSHRSAEPVDEPEEEEEEKTPVARPEHSDDSLLSESLAKIFIKQGRYARAHEIISGLSLKFPKKSAYFADQLRFLQKLIINQQRLKAQNSPGASEK